ncbi:MAG: PAS domain-containing sensor histidine kinase [Deltaproteobacteria bacterium]|nr:PAS domain-containing sensor histidine kinase [Deltaproteobacteria bacterium]TLN04917.1 MAG: PAS domain S-box protein [bacterium]
MIIHDDFFKRIFNTVRDAILILDENMRVLAANRSFFTIFKVDAADTIGSLLYDLGNGQWGIPHLRVLLEDILPKNDTVDDYEIEHEFESIGRKTMLLNACKIREKKDGLPIILLAIEDITERKRLEDLLSDSEERYRRIFETASDGILLLEKNRGHIVHANPASEKMLGYSKEEYFGKKLEDIGVPIDTRDFPVIMQSLKRCGILNYDNVEVTTRSGHSINTDIYLVDRARLAQCNIRDVTERKQAAEKLAEEKAFTENALNAMTDTFYVFDVEGRFLRWNKTLNTVTGYLDSEIASMKPVDFFRTEDKARVAEAIREASRGSANIDAVLVAKDGRHIPFEFSATRLNDAQGKLIGISGVGRDISDRKKLEAQLRHAQKMEAVGTLAGGIAHDFNNILNVILGYGTLIMETLDAVSPLKGHMREVLNAADRAASLTKRLLVFSRKQVVEVKPVDINELILGLQKMLVRIIKESIDFTLDLADRPLIVPVDAGQIEQVLINLVANARDAMPECGRLTISTSLLEVDDAYVAAYGYGKPGKYALVMVADTGHGMDAETLKRIFEPFFTTKGIGEGTGLGLSICYGIIKQHSGFINVYSEPGQGTVVKIYLPLSGEASHPGKITEEAVTVRGGTETILFAEDDASVRTLTKIVLESSGYTVISAVDGEDAITKFMENRDNISLALLDMIMPRKNGREVSESILKVNPRMKVLFMSGYTMDIIKSRECTDNVFEIILKPFQPKGLLIKVREVLDR